MTAIQFLAEWALRSGILIVSGALLLWALRVKDASIRLAAWTAMLVGSLAIPMMTASLPKMPFAVMRAPAQVVISNPIPAISLGKNDAAVPDVPVSKPFDWSRAVLIVYSLIAGALLLRLATGLAMSMSLRRRSQATGQAMDGIELRESELLNSPVALGVVRPVILLPLDWRQWDGAKLNAVLAHERSHIRRHDPEVQLLSAIHRALLWFSPLSWFLHRRLVRVAEEASDDAAVASACDRAMYAKVLLEFVERGVRRANWLGVPMARHGRPDERIDRILDGQSLSSGVTRWSVAAILTLGLPLAYLAGVARPVEARPQAQQAVIAPAADDQGNLGAQPAAAQIVPQAKRAASPSPAADYLAGLGEVTAYTVTIKPRVDGQLMSVGFKEGDQVQAGQLLATIDPSPYQLQLVQAEGQLARDQAQLSDIRRNRNALPADQFESLAALAEGSMKTDQAKLDAAKLQLAYTQITSPITGVAGLRSVDPGNIVHASDATGIVVINQLQPISVLFQISEDRVPDTLARVGQGAKLVVEAWDRGNQIKLATGRLVGFDNQIDRETGDLKFKAEFDNKDRALFPGQFVNIRLFLNK